MDFCLLWFIRTEVHHSLRWYLRCFVVWAEFCDYFWQICAPPQSTFPTFFRRYKTVNELPVSDWLAMWKQTPEPFNYTPLVSMRLPRCDVRHICRQLGFYTPGWKLPVVAPTHETALSTKCLGMKAFSIHVFTDPLTLFNGAKWIWRWLMNNRARTDPSFNPYLPPCMRRRFVSRELNKSSF